jgi:inner membrane protein
MASAFAHIVIPATLYFAFKSPTVNWRLFVVGAGLSVVPDADVLGFHLGIAYSSQWGHRGFTHSFVFAVVVALLAANYFKPLRSKPGTVFLFGFISCLSHALLDALTNGGLGVALYWPLNHERVFSGFRPILVSPIGIKSFFTPRSWSVLVSEAQWVLLPCLALGCVLYYLRRIRRRFL